ncbi:MAG: LysR substrate-binding domain-containing protein, partial [Pseudomonadota bacterium]
AGYGVALGRTALVSRHLQKGRLVRPLMDSRPADFAYYAVTTAANATRPRVRTFIEWLQAEVARDDDVQALGDALIF